MAAAPAVSVDEYLRTDYEPHCEYLDGVLLSKSAPDYIHSRLQALLIGTLCLTEKAYGLEGLPELHIRVTPTRFRVPDVTALTEPPRDGRYPDRRTPPLFTVEIASLDEPWSALRGKVTDHLAIGVSTVIIADPYTRTVLVADQATPLRELTHPLIVEIPVPGGGVLKIDFDDLYAKL
jgi:Uma2 family endonuclease